MHLPYWSLSGWGKRQVKEAMKFIEKFEESVCAYAKQEGFDAVVCGHIHHPSMREINGVLYFNDGDWVETCTALVETLEGDLQIIQWRLGEDPLVLFEKKLS